MTDRAPIPGAAGPSPYAAGWRLIGWVRLFGQLCLSTSFGGAMGIAAGFVEKPHLVLEAPWIAGDPALAFAGLGGLGIVFLLLAETARAVLDMAESVREPVRPHRR